MSLERALGKVFRKMVRRLRRRLEKRPGDLPDVVRGLAVLCGEMCGWTDPDWIADCVSALLSEVLGQEVHLEPVVLEDLMRGGG